jgi:prepilin-type N-terminal cleavage/methylation domain-containing protein
MTMRSQTAKRDRRGFSLPELMVAIMILTVGLLGLAATMASMMRYQDLASNRAEMAGLGDSKLEQLRGAGSTRSTDTLQLAVGGSLTTSVSAHADTVTTLRGRIYFRRWLVTAGPAGSRDVELRVAPQLNDIRTPTKVDVSTIVIIY